MRIKGAREYEKFQASQELTRKEAILAQCYVCNGMEAEDCKGKSCPLYRFCPYRKKDLLPS